MFSAVRKFMVAIDRLVDRLLDPRRRERTVVWLLVGFTLVWSLYGSISNASIDVHNDVGELVGAWRDSSFAFHHPPLAVWIAGTWFTVFPHTDWASYLLAMSAVSASLWIAWKLFGDFLDDIKRIAALAMLTLIPLLTFHALKFNANTAQIPFWAATSWFFLLSFITCDPRFAVLAGIAGGGALLAKYWSVYLIASLGLAALINNRRRIYFTSASPWITLVVGLVVISPHLYSLASGHKQSLAFVVVNLASEPIHISCLNSIYYLAGAAAYVSVPIMLLILLRPSRPALTDLVLPATTDRRIIALAFWLSLLLPAAVNLFAPTRLTSLWTIPNWTLLPVVLLSSPLISVSRRAVARILALALAVPLGAIVAAPAVAIILFLKANSTDQSHFEQVAQEVDLFWRASTPEPLKYLGGDPKMAMGVAYYLRSAAPNFDLQRHMSEDANPALRAGVALICPESNSRCLDALKTLCLRYGCKRKEVAMRRNFLGIVGNIAQYTIAIIPPERESLRDLTRPIR
jgi:hypothetical protein